MLTGNRSSYPYRDNICLGRFTNISRLFIPSMKIQAQTLANHLSSGLWLIVSAEEQNAERHS